MFQQDTLDFNWGNPLTRRFEAIVAPAHVPPESVGITPVQIAGSCPAVHERFRRSLSPLPVARCGAVATNPKVADFTSLGGRAFMINQLCFVTAQQLTAAPITQVT